MRACVRAVDEEALIAASAKEAEAVPAITVTTEEETAAAVAASDDKNKGAYEQLKELLESDKQQQVAFHFVSYFILHHFNMILCVYWK